MMAGILLERLSSPPDFALCFLLAGVSMAISWVFLAAMREPDSLQQDLSGSRGAFWNGVRTILQRDAKFRWFLVARVISQVAMAAFAFYTIYAMRHHSMSEAAVGLMTGVLLATQIVANPCLGWVGDRWGHRAVMEIGALAAAISALLAWWAPDVSWFYLVFILAGIANVSFSAIAMTMTLNFGTEAERPAYIGLANTLAAPGTILAPLIGGWLVSSTGYQAVFLMSAAGGLATAMVLHLKVHDPRQTLSCWLTPVCSD